MTRGRGPPLDLRDQIEAARQCEHRGGGRGQRPGPKGLEGLETPSRRRTVRRSGGHARQEVRQRCASETAGGSEAGQLAEQGRGRTSVDGGPGRPYAVGERGHLARDLESQAGPERQRIPVWAALSGQRLPQGCRVLRCVSSCKVPGLAACDAVVRGIAHFL